MEEHLQADVVVIGAGLAGLVATAELTDRGRTVLLLDQEPEASLGGQAFWSLGGLFLVDTPEQRRCRVRDSLELAWQDWEGTAGFDRPEDAWPRQWARAYVEFAATEKRDWLHAMGMRWLPNPGWPERGGYGAIGPGNSVPPLPRHVGHGAGGARSVRRPVSIRAGARTGDLRAPPPGRRADRLRRLSDRRGGRGARAQRRGARRGELAHPGRQLHRRGRGRPGHLRRDRGQPRARAGQLAAQSRHAAAGPDLRRPGPRRRQDARDLAAGRGPSHRRGPDVALHRGDRELVADLVPPRDPHPARAVVAVARRGRPAPARAPVPGVRHARDARPHRTQRSRPHPGSC